MDHVIPIASQDHQILKARQRTRNSPHPGTARRDDVKVQIGKYNIQTVDDGVKQQDFAVAGLQPRRSKFRR